MNRQKGWFWMVGRLALVFIGVLLLAGCGPDARIGALRSESQSVEFGDAKSARVEIEFGAGDLQLSGEAEKLLEADFTYNVEKLKPVIEKSGEKLVVRQPDIKGFPALGAIQDFRNEWSLRFSNQVPMDLNVNMGAGTSDLKFGGLSLTGLSVKLGAGTCTIDLSGDWKRDLDVIIDTGAADLTVLLPESVGVRVEVDAGPTKIDAQDLTRDGDFYTNAAYGVSEVTLHINLKAGIGLASLEVAK